jgi:hypothetical protein
MMFGILGKTQINKLAKNLHRVILFTLLVGMLFLNFLPGAASADRGWGSFQLTKSCKATTSISGRNPRPVDIDQIYEIVAFNKDYNPSHVYIKVPGAGTRWVNLNCGIVVDSPVATVPKNPQPAPSKPDNKPSKPKFIPFFDDIDNPVELANGELADISPPPPQLNKFDEAINELCGPVGKVVGEEEFKTTIEKFPDVFASIKNYVGGEIFPGRSSDDEFLEDLTTLWFKALGFDHVFCGEPGQNKIGGLHFAGRYLDLQKKGLGGIFLNKKAEVLPGAVYTLGVTLKDGDHIIKDPIKGYGYTLNAEEILKFAAKAYKENPNDGTGTKGCILTITDDGKTFTNVFVTKNGAIRTFFPDATPDYDRNPPCNQ